LLDCSPFLKALSLSQKDKQHRVLLQEWKRNDSEKKFCLTTLSFDRLVKSATVYEALPLETQLETLIMPVDNALSRVLPRCSSIRSLSILGLTSKNEVTSLSSALSQSPSIRSLHLLASDPLANLDLSLLPLSSLNSFQMVYGSTLKFVSTALTKHNGKPNSLTSLELRNLSGNFEPLADALLECSALSRLTLVERRPNADSRAIFSVVQVLHRLPLTSLTLLLPSYTDQSIECLVSFLPQSSVQDLRLGTLSPKQVLLLAATLPSLSSLHCLEFNTRNYDSCQHSAAHLALFSALSSSSLCSLQISSTFFRLSTLDACLNKLPSSSKFLTQLSLDDCTIFSDRTLTDRDPFEKVDLIGNPIVFDWCARFPHLTDRFCMVTINTAT
jgi:hypothetical protein